MLRPFLAAGYELFPLARGRKIPRDKGWRVKSYANGDLKQWLANGGNLGVRLRDTDLVLDIDPRNYRLGDNPLARLSSAVGVDLSNAPTVVTGRGDGGRHLYFRKPANLRIVGKLDAYPGIDFRSVGALVVAPGSIHPDTGKVYTVDDATSPAIADVAHAPAALLDMLTRPEPDISIVPTDRVGRISNEQLADLLAVLDPTAYGPGRHDEWFGLMAAAHDATAGHGLPEWLEWCARDGLYANGTDEEATSRRWHSLTAGKDGGASYRTLLRTVADAGRADLVAALDDDNDGALDFEDASPEPDQSGAYSIAGLKLWRADKITAKPLMPLWPGRFYLGKLATLAGEPDKGKSVWVTDLAARISRGMPWPDDSGNAPVGSVLLLNAEDDPADTTTPRLMAAGADLSKVHILESLVEKSDKGKEMFNFATDLPRLRVAAKAIPDLRAIIIDPTNAYMGSSKQTDSFRDSDVRAVLGPFKELCEEMNIAGITIMHFRKGGGGKAADRVMGSLAFTALARSAWAIMGETDADGEDTGRRLLARIKSNIAAPADAMAFRLVGVEVAEGITAPKIEWEGIVAGAADDLSPDAQGRRGGKRAAAAAFLIDELVGGPVPASVMLGKLKGKDFSKRTLERAKADAGVISYQNEDTSTEARQWYWKLKDCSPAAEN